MTFYITLQSLEQATASSEVDGTQESSFSIGFNNLNGKFSFFLTYLI